MAAIGLGGFPFDGFAPIFVLGGTPIARGLGFRFVSDKKGVPNPVGKDHLFQALCPPYCTMNEAVDTVINEKFGKDGMLTLEKRRMGPYKDYEKISGKLERLPQEAIECTRSIVNYAYETYGRFPVNYDAIMIPIAVQAHHPDMEFYENFINLPLPEAVLNHMKSWHG